MQVSQTAALSSESAERSKDNQVGTLLRSITRGEEAAPFFLEAVQGLIFGVLLTLLGNTKDAEAVLVEVFEEVGQRAAEFNKQNETAVTWLLLIAHRRAVEHLCRQPTTISAALQKGHTHPTFSINITEQRRLIREAMEAIPPSQHRMIELAFLSGLSDLEISDQLGQSPAAVEGCIRSAMLRLFRMFKSMGFSIDARSQT